MMLTVLLLICILSVVLVSSFKLPNVDFKTDVDIDNIHDQIFGSIINSTVTSLNFSAVHISCEVILLILIALSYKRLSSVLFVLSEQFLRIKAKINANQKSKSSPESEVL